MPVLIGPSLLRPGLVSLDSSRAVGMSIRRQPDDSTFSPHSHRIAVSLMALKGITNRRAKRTPDSIEITSPFDGCRA